jgi:hypothetical protein
MEMFRNFRLSRGKLMMHKKQSRIKRSRFRGNINTAKKIGIVWDATKPEEFAVITQFHQKMAEKNIEVQVIGYYPGKEIPDKITAIRYLTCLKHPDLNFFYRPVSEEAVRFMNTPFDILFDTNFRNTFPLQYISCLSAAGIKVGIFENGYDNSPFDLMIEMKPGDLSGFFTQAIHYLEMINTKN